MKKLVLQTGLVELQSVQGGCSHGPRGTRGGDWGPEKIKQIVIFDFGHCWQLTPSACGESALVF